MARIPISVGDSVYRKKAYKNRYAAKTREAKVVASAEPPLKAKGNQAGWFKFRYVDGDALDGEGTEEEVLHYTCFVKNPPKEPSPPSSPSPTGSRSRNIPTPKSILKSAQSALGRGRGQRDRGRKVTYTEHDENEFDETTATPTRRRGGPTDAVCTPVGTSDNRPRNSIRMSSVKSKNGEIHTPNRLDEYSSESDGNESDDDDTSDFEWDDESVDSDSGVNPIGPGPAPDDVSVDEDDIEEDAALVFDEDGQVDEDATNFCNDEEEEEEEESTSKRKRGGSKSTSKGKGKGKGKRKKKPKLPYKEALELYNKEKAEHIEKGTMFVVQTGKTKIAKGVRVETKKAPRRKGTVIADRKKVQGRWKWEVQFDDDDGNTECFAPQSLKLLANVVEYTWKTVEDHVPTATPSNDDLPDFIRRKGDDDYETIGVQGFNFNLFRNENVDLSDSTSESYSYLRLLMHLYPGDWKDDLDRLNEAARETNVRILTRSEFWAFIGVYLSAAKHGVGGEKLFEKRVQVKRKGSDESRQTNKRTTKDPVDICSKIQGGAKGFTQNRFNQIKSIWPFAFHDQGAKQAGDPWWRFIGLLNGFNENRYRTIAASRDKVFDETMCPHKPRTTKTGHLPNISFVKRKPKPLGTEWKNVACCVTGIMLFLELQRGKEPMKKMKYYKERGTTAACVQRGIVTTQYQGHLSAANPDSSDQARAKSCGDRERFWADSWFTSLRALEGADEEGHDLFGVVKTGLAGCPVKEVEEMMEQWPSGSYIVLESTTPKLQDVFLVGYRYSGGKNPIMFLGTDLVGSTLPGEPYTARFADKNGNVKTRGVVRPDVCSKYFGVSNIIDMHNQARQGILRLEELWRTIDPYQKLFETILGITVVDCWKGVKHAMRRNSDNIHHGMGIVDFADRIAWDCLNVPASFFDEAINVGDVEGDIGNSVSRPASASTGPRCDPHLPFLPEGWQTMDEKTLFKETKKLHKSKKTDKKGSDNKALRRACQAKGRGCKNTENRQNRECNNPGCAAVERTMNRNTTIGVFLCKRKNCRNAHVADIIKTHCNRDVGHLVKNNSDSDSDSD